MCCRYYNECYYDRLRREREHAFVDGFNKGCQESARVALDLVKPDKRHDNGDLDLVDLAPDYYDYNRGGRCRNYYDNGYGYNGYNGCCCNGCGYY